MRGNTNEVYSIALSPDDNYIASGGMDMNLRIFHTKTMQLVHETRDH